MKLVGIGFLVVIGLLTLNELSKIIINRKK